MKQPDKPTLNRDEQTGELVSGVGPGTVEAFLDEYYSHTKRLVQIASAYFTVKGYTIGTKYLGNRTIQFEILVGIGEGASAQSSIIHEVEHELADCRDDLWNAVAQLVERMERKQFIIRDAREMVDARGLEIDFHCKYYICDGTLLWHGSGNNTGRGIRTTIEQASLIRSRAEVASFVRRFKYDMDRAKDLLPDLLARLKEWLKLAPPFHVYSLMLHKLNKLFVREPENGLDLPVYYQQAVIMRAVEQVRLYDGCIVVAATGLGKTVIGAEIGYQLKLHKRTRRIILIAPQAVHIEWRRHFKARDFYVDYVSIETLFRDTSDTTLAHHQTAILEQILAQAGSETLIIIDEGHRFRNELRRQYMAFVSKRRRKKQPKGSLVYKRLNPVIDQGAAIILLTATPYGTDKQNLNSMLRLLPNRYQNPLLNEPDAWQAKSIEDFIKLPVVTVLGLHDVLKLARTRRDVDENQRLFVQFDTERRYLPRYIDIRQVNYELPLLDNLRKAFDKDYFAHAALVLTDFYDDDDDTNKTGVVDTADKNFIAAWLSSPSAVRESLIKNLYTLGADDADGSPAAGQQTLFASDAASNSTYPSKKEREDKGYKAVMKRNWHERQAVLAPILDKLKTVVNDHKSDKLVEVIQRHCLEHQEKVIVFVKRHPTAVFIEQALSNQFGDTVRIGCTVQATDTKYELKKLVYRQEILRRFSPKSHRLSEKNDFNILICTDADGVGVNLQDANVIINYDPTEGADTLFQRVGRVLRFTADPERVVHVYTFIPSFIQQSQPSKARTQVRQTFNRMMTRHAKSRHILGLDVMSNNAIERIDLNDPEIEGRLAVEFDYYVVTGTDQSHPLFHHVAVREQYHELAKTLREGIHSARYYEATDKRIAVLIDVSGEKRVVLQNVTNGLFEHDDDMLAILDMICCEESTQNAFVNPAQVESSAKQAVRLWCEKRAVRLDAVSEICAMYLLPKPRKFSVAPVIEDIYTPLKRKWYNRPQ